MKEQPNAALEMEPLARGRGRRLPSAPRPPPALSQGCPNGLSIHPDVWARRGGLPPAAAGRERLHPGGPQHSWRAQEHSGRGKATGHGQAPKGSRGRSRAGAGLGRWAGLQERWRLPWSGCRSAAPANCSARSSALAADSPRAPVFAQPEHRGHAAPAGSSSGLAPAPLRTSGPRGSGDAGFAAVPMRRDRRHRRPFAADTIRKLEVLSGRAACGHQRPAPSLWVPQNPPQPPSGCAEPAMLGASSPWLSVLPGPEHVARCPCPPLNLRGRPAPGPSLAPSQGTAAAPWGDARHVAPGATSRAVCFPPRPRSTVLGLCGVLGFGGC